VNILSTWLYVVVIKCIQEASFISRESFIICLQYIAVNMFSYCKVYIILVFQFNVSHKIILIFDLRKETLMVNNFTNINKTNNHLSPQLTEHKKETTYDVGNSGLCLGQTKKCCGIKCTLILHFKQWRQSYRSLWNDKAVPWWLAYSILMCDGWAFCLW
jgi:hypothetical protein